MGKLEKERLPEARTGVARTDLRVVYGCQGRPSLPAVLALTDDETTLRPIWERSILGIVRIPMFPGGQQLAVIGPGMLEFYDSGVDVGFVCIGRIPEEGSLRV